MHGHGKEESAEGQVLIRGPSRLPALDGKWWGGGAGDFCAREEGHTAPALSTPGGHPYHLRYLPNHMLSPSPRPMLQQAQSGPEVGCWGGRRVGYVKGQIVAQASKK